VKEMFIKKLQEDMAGTGSRLGGSKLVGAGISN
jgi:hypothetical protein